MTNKTKISVLDKNIFSRCFEAVASSSVENLENQELNFSTDEEEADSKHLEIVLSSAQIFSSYFIYTVSY